MAYVLCRELNKKLYYFSKASDMESKSCSKLVWISAGIGNIRDYFLVDKKDGEYLLRLMNQDYGDRGVFLHEVKNL